MLLNVKQLRWYPAAVGFGCSIASILYVIVKYAILKPMHQDPPMDVPTTKMLLWNQCSLLASAAYSLPLYVILGFKQKVEMANDAQKLEELTKVIKDLDADGDGEVSKKELKAVFQKLFPGGSNFEETWDTLDSDGSGSLTIKELANHFGMGHLVQGTKEEEEAHAVFIKFDRASKADISGKTTKFELDKEDLKSTKASIKMKMKEMKENMDFLLRWRTPWMPARSHEPTWQ